MSDKTYYIKEMCFFIALEKLRETPKVDFFIVPGMIGEVSAIDQVRHEPGAISPTFEGCEVEKPWYYHPDQEDNLLVYCGKRTVDLFTTKHGKVETFEVTPDYVKHGNEMVFEGPCIFGWPTHVFHRIQSPEGSNSSNFAFHKEGFDISTNFSVYDLNTETGEFSVIREGHHDQPEAINRG